MVRPNLQGLCPTGHLPCNKNANPSNIICLEETDELGLGRSLEERCPIVELQIKKKSAVPNWQNEVESNQNIGNTEDYAT